MLEFLGAVLIAVVGGSIGATIGAASAHLRSRSEMRREAMLALWEYQRALSAFSLSQLSDLMDSDQQFISVGSFQEVRSAHRLAYPWSSLLPGKIRNSIFQEALIETPFPHEELESIEATANSAGRLASQLERELRREFPLRTADWWRYRFSRSQAGD